VPPFRTDSATALLEAKMHAGKYDVFIGRSGAALWRDAEVELILNKFLRPRKPVIPVILEAKRGNPRLPGFLELTQWVDMRLTDPDPIDQLIWGITGTQHPSI
jgi:hypothetical protein